MDRIEQSGRTVEDALQRALAALGLNREDAEVEVVDEGSRGVLGLGAREARVKVTRRRGRGDAAKTVTEQLLDLMGFPASVRTGENPESIQVEITGEHLGPVIGKHGHTLGAIETLVALVVGRRLGAPVRIEMDVEGYRERRTRALQDLAHRIAEQVARQGREMALEPMDSRDRRLIHLALQEHPLVTTASRGEGEVRRVVIMPRGAVASAQSRERGGPDRRFFSRGRHRSDSESGWQRGKGDRMNEIGQTNPRRVSESSRSSQIGRGGGPEGRPSRVQEGSSTPSRWAGRKSQAPRLGPHTPAARPEGLPVDEELEAEIEAHLAKERDGESAKPHHNPTQGSDPD